MSSRARIFRLRDEADGSSSTRMFPSWHRRSKEQTQCWRSRLPPRSLSEALIQAQEDERERIARDLHDEVGQSLMTVKMAIENAMECQINDENKEQGRQMLECALLRIRGTIDSVRKISHNLRPPILDDLGLIRTLESLGREFRLTNPKITLIDHLALEESQVPEEYRCDLFRVVQEGLHNIIKHANASQVELLLYKSKDGIHMRLSDNGDGFEVNKRKRNGLGLSSMRARSEKCGGFLRVWSEPGQGTRIEASWPLHDGEETMMC